MIMISRRRHLQNGIWGFLLIDILLLTITFLLSGYIENTIIGKGVYFLQVLCLTYVMAVMIGYVFSIFKHGGIKKYLKTRSIVRVVETNLISIGAYEKKRNVTYAILPRIKVKDSRIIIDLKDIKIRDKICNSIDSFSTALPGEYIVEDYYINAGNNQLHIEYEDVGQYTQEQYSIDEYKKMISQIDSTTFYVDRKHSINMNDYPHLLYSGGTGSGKTYAAMQIVIQAIIKNWDVMVLDIKRSYGLFKRYVDYEVDPERIVEALKVIESEMYKRLEDLEPVLNSNPKALACDCGYKNKLIVIEEYISLKSALDKKKSEELERIVKNISVLSRQSCIHILIVMQAAGTENINASTRAQFSKMLLGNAQSNIINATFGNGVDIPNTMIRRNKGEGLLNLERVTIVRIPKIPDIEKFEK